MKISDVTLKQNDLPKAYNSPNGKNEHCYSMTLFVCACVSIGINPTLKHYIECYERANKKNILGDETNIHTHGAYVYSDRAWPQLVIDYFGHKKEWKRAGKLPEKAKSDFVIVNGKTKNGGHFRELNYDPWYKEVKMLYVKSVKYYIVK